MLLTVRTMIISLAGVGLFALQVRDLAQRPASSILPSLTPPPGAVLAYLGLIWCMDLLSDLDKALYQSGKEAFACRCVIAVFDLVSLPDNVGINLGDIDDEFDEFEWPTPLSWSCDAFVRPEAIMKVSIAHIIVVINCDSWLVDKRLIVADFVGSSDSNIARFAVDAFGGSRWMDFRYEGYDITSI